MYRGVRSVLSCIQAMDRHDSPAVSLLRGWSGLSRGLFRLSGARYRNIDPLEPRRARGRDDADNQIRKSVCV